MTDIYMSTSQLGGSMRTMVEMWDWDTRPLNVLVSFASLGKWANGDIPEFLCKRKVMLDSGAFTAFNTGRTIDLVELCAEAAHPIYDEAIALDVIGGGVEDNKRNALHMLESLGPSKSIPVFHLGEPWELLEFYAEHWPKIGVGGLATIRVNTQFKMKWIRECFARVYPKRIHGFGVLTKEILLKFPFDSADASTWATASCAFGKFLLPGPALGYRQRSSAKGKPSATGGRASAVVGLGGVWELEAMLQKRWKTELRQLRK